MKYEGKLFGKVGGKYFPLHETTEDFENLKQQLEEKDREIERLKADLKYTYEYAEKQREVKQLLVDEPLANQSAAGWISDDKARQERSKQRCEDDLLDGPNTKV